MMITTTLDITVRQVTSYKTPLVLLSLLLVLIGVIILIEKMAVKIALTGKRIETYFVKSKTDYIERKKEANGYLDEIDETEDGGAWPDEFKKGEDIDEIN